MLLLKANRRDILGKKSRLLRKQGLVPSTIYGPGIEPISVSVSRKDFSALFKQVGYAVFFDIQIDDLKPKKVLVKEIQVHPVDRSVLSISFYQVREDRKITANVPIKIVGEASVVKQNLGFLVQQMDSISLHCLPKYLPQCIEVDVSNIENINDVITVADVKLPEGVELDSSVDLSMSILYVATAQKLEIQDQNNAESNTAETTEPKTE